MAEKEPIRIFICGTSVLSNKQELPILKKMYTTLIHTPNVEVANANTLFVNQSEIRNPNFMEDIEANLKEADAAIFNATNPSLETVQQMTLADRVHRLPIGIFYRDDSNPKRMLMHDKLRAYSWQEERTLEEELHRFTADMRAKKNGEEKQRSDAVRGEVITSKDEIIEEMIKQGLVRTGRLSFDFQKERVLYRDKEIDTLPSERKVLFHLARNIDSLVTFEKFRAFFRSVGMTADWEMLRQLIRKSVHKVNSYEKVPYVETIFNVGCRLDMHPLVRVPLPKTEKIGRFDLDLTNQQVWEGNERRPTFGPVVTSLLTVFSSKRGVPLTLNDVAEHVWPGVEVTEANYKHLVNRLRAKLGDKGPNFELIVRTNGGYMLIEEEKSKSTETPT